MTYEHPRWPKRHKATIETAELGCKITCVCGFWSTARNQAQATRAYLEHVRTDGEESA